MMKMQPPSTGGEDQGPQITRFETVWLGDDEKIPSSVEQVRDTKWTNVGMGEVSLTKLNKGLPES